MTFRRALALAIATDAVNTAARFGNWLLHTPVADHAIAWLEAQDTAYANALNDDTED